MPDGALAPLPPVPAGTPYPEFDAKQRSFERNRTLAIISYAAGYPVGRVVEVRARPGQSFADVIAEQYGAQPGFHRIARIPVCPTHYERPSRIPGSKRAAAVANNLPMGGAGYLSFTMTVLAGRANLALVVAFLSVAIILGGALSLSAVEHVIAKLGVANRLELFAFARPAAA